MKNKRLDLLAFGYRQAMSCIFPVVIFATLAITKWFPIPGMARYDIILIVCLLTPLMMVALRVICVKHGVVSI